MASLLVIGGARSGKSRYAQHRAEATGLRPIYIATAQARDAEMATRIADHQVRRSNLWQLVEAPLDVPQAIAHHSGAETVLLVDCLTMWLSNLLLAEDSGECTGSADRGGGAAMETASYADKIPNIRRATDSLLAAIAAARGEVILVSNEVGGGIVPTNTLARCFRDEAGLLNQKLAQAVDEVHLIIAGLEVALKGR